MKSAKHAFLLLLALSMILGNSVIQAAAKDTDTFVVAIRAEPSTLDPHNSTALANFAVQRVVYDNLVEQNADGAIQPALAERWEVMDDLTVRFYLRDGVFFTNGEKLTAEDVRYSLERATKQRGSASMFSAFDGEKTAVVDERTIDIKMKYPFAPIYNYLASSRGNIICKKAIEEMGADKYARNPVGTGPFILEKWISGDSLVLKANKSYWGQKPAYETLIYRVITEHANRSIELETGGVQAIFDVSDNDIPRLEKNPKIKVVQGPGYKFSYITMNMSIPPYDNIKVREALTISLNMPAIVKAVYQGGAKLADSLSKFLDSKSFQEGLANFGRWMKQFIADVWPKISAALADMITGFKEMLPYIKAYYEFVNIINLNGFITALKVIGKIMVMLGAVISAVENGITRLVRLFNALLEMLSKAFKLPVPHTLISDLLDASIASIQVWLPYAKQLNDELNKIKGTTTSVGAVTVEVSDDEVQAVLDVVKARRDAAQAALDEQRAAIGFISIRDVGRKAVIAGMQNRVAGNVPELTDRKSVV